MVSIKENIINSLTWFYKLLQENDISVLQNEINELADMIVSNNFYAPIAADDSGDAIIVDDDGYAIFADWKYKEE